MLKLRLFMTVLTATIVVLLMTRTMAIDSSQMDTLKNQFLPAEYRNTNFTLDDLKRVFKAKCRKATGIDNSTLYQEIEQQAVVFTKCISGLANLTSLQQEIETARPIGELDTVFHKHCLKAPQANKCFHDFNLAIQPCLSKKEKSQNTVMMRIFSGLLTFMCARGGDQLALFVAEDGPECFEANKDAITHCANRSFTEFMPKDKTLADFINLPDFVLEPEHCLDLVKFETCTMHHLEMCREITPANVADAVFRFVKNETSCKTWLKKKANEKSVLLRSTANLAHLNVLLFFICSVLIPFGKNFF